MKTCWHRKPPRIHRNEWRQAYLSMYLIKKKGGTHDPLELIFIYLAFNISVPRKRASVRWAGLGWADSAEELKRAVTVVVFILMRWIFTVWSTAVQSALVDALSATRSPQFRSTPNSQFFINKFSISALTSPGPSMLRFFNSYHFLSLFH